MGDDIREIESQNRGLQILAQNQQKLSRDLDYLLVSDAIWRYVMNSQLNYDYRMPSLFLVPAWTV